MDETKTKPKTNNNIFRLLRIARDWTVRELAEKLDVSSAYINSIEKKERTPSARLIKEYAKVLEVNEKTIIRYMKKPEENTMFEKLMLNLLRKIIVK